MKRFTPNIYFMFAQAFDKEDAKAYENIRSIKEKDALTSAIESCVCPPEAVFFLIFIGAKLFAKDTKKTK